MTRDVANKFFKAKKALIEHVGLIPDWVECPIDDCREMYWKIGNGKVVIYSEEKSKVEVPDGSHYEDEVTTKEYYAFWYEYWTNVKKDPKNKEMFKDEIYTQRFYPKWIYRGKKYTLIFCDPHVDGCKWWRIFDNKKEIDVG